MSKKLIVFIDSGDTLVNEGTEYRNEGSPIVQSCELIDGAKEMLLTLKERGYTIELVADGYTQSFDNSYGQHGLKNIFDARTISEEVKFPTRDIFCSKIIPLLLIIIHELLYSCSIFSPLVESNRPL